MYGAWSTFEIPAQSLDTLRGRRDGDPQHKCCGKKKTTCIKHCLGDGGGGKTGDFIRDFMNEYDSRDKNWGNDGIAMTGKEIGGNETDLSEARVKGQDVPPPYTSFNNCNFPRPSPFGMGEKNVQHINNQAKLVNFRHSPNIMKSLKNC